MRRMKINMIMSKRMLRMMRMQMRMMGNLCSIRIQVIATHMTAEMKEDATESSEKKNNMIH